MARVDSYDRDAPIPEVGSRWIWEPNRPYARQLVQVVEVKWNGEEWWVDLKPLTLRRVAPGYMRTKDPEHAWNDLSRFWQACVPAGELTR